MAIQEEEYVDKKVDLSMWKKLLGHAKPFYTNILFVFVFMCLSSAADVAYPLIMSKLVDNNMMPRTWQGAVPTMILYVLVMLAQITTTYGFIKNCSHVENGLTNHIRKIAFDKLQKLSFSYYDVTPVGYIMSRVTSDASRLSDFIAWSCCDLFYSIAFMLIAVITMLVVNPVLGLITMATTPVIAVISYFFQKVILKNHRLLRAANSKITGAFNEGIMGARTTKTLVREQANAEEFVALTDDMRHYSIRSACLSALYTPIIQVIGTVGTSMILWFGGVQHIAGDITLGQFSFFMTLGSFFFDPITNLAGIFAEMQSAQAAVERVITLIDTEPDVKDTPEVIAVYGDEFTGKTENWPKLLGDVEFDNVTFRYKDGQAVLKNFNLHVRPGEKIALVGETGSGKSTIVNLVCRFYEPSEGEIRIDGVNYRERSQLWLHSHLGYVLQSPHLFSGTIRENIRYGRLDATDEEVEQVAKMVNAHAFIVQLEHGYDTQVGEGGGRLSTGEKQLISFARALLADPAIFVLDEATSSIDTETEMLIQHTIERVLDGRTSFIIAHRLSTIRNSDRILVIHQGEIVESGTHDELMALHGRYYDLYTTQFREESQQRAMQQLGIRMGSDDKEEEPAVTMEDDD